MEGHNRLEPVPFFSSFFFSNIVCDHFSYKPVNKFVKKLEPNRRERFMGFSESFDIMDLEAAAISSVVSKRNTHTIENARRGETHIHLSLTHSLSSSTYIYERVYTTTYVCSNTAYIVWRLLPVTALGLFLFADIRLLWLKLRL